MASCKKCGGEGRLYKSRYGGNDPDVWDAGECPLCEGTGHVRDECEYCGVYVNPMSHPCLEEDCPHRAITSSPTS